jgi:hypothetical protein
MIKLIKKVDQPKKEFMIGSTASFSQSFHDGRSYEVITKTGLIVKINRVTVDIQLENGSIYRVSKDIVK